MKTTYTKPMNYAMNYAMNCLVATGAAAALLAGVLCTQAQAQTAMQEGQGAATLNAARERITDQAIRADQATYTATQARIAALNGTGKVPVANYDLSKAQCWLDVSFHEYTRNDRSNFPQEALGQADAILTALERKSTPNPSVNTPLVNQADKLRDDLWAQSASLKNGRGLSCYAQKLACAEVELVHAGNEHKQQGWRHAKPYIQIAEDLIAEAQATGDRCIATPVAAPVAQMENINLAADALFKFDKWSAYDLLPEGKATLNELAAKLKAGYVQIDRIQVTGYTDRLGSVQHNQVLSERRAQTVKQYLQSQGVSAPIESNGKGKSDQLVACGTSDAHTPERIQCLQPNRRVAVSVTGVRRK